MSFFSWMVPEVYQEEKKMRYLELVDELSRVKALERIAQYQADKYTEMARQAEIMYAEVSERVRTLTEELKKFRGS